MNGHIGGMWHRYRLFLPVVLILSLIAAGQAIAASKGANPATGMMTLCTGKGIVTVLTDADGQPTSAPHLCPDCALSALSGTLPPDAAPLLVGAGTALRSAWPPTAAFLPSEVQPSFPRGPPLSA